MWFGFGKKFDPIYWLSSDRLGLAISDYSCLSVYYESGVWSWSVIGVEVGIWLSQSGEFEVPVFVSCGLRNIVWK